MVLSFKFYDNFVVFFHDKYGWFNLNVPSLTDFVPKHVMIKHGEFAEFCHEMVVVIDLQLSW